MNKVQDTHGTRRWSNQVNFKSIEMSYLYNHALKTQEEKLRTQKKTSRNRQTDREIEKPLSTNRFQSTRMRFFMEPQPCFLLFLPFLILDISPFYVIFTSWQFHDFYFILKSTLSVSTSFFLHWRLETGRRHYKIKVFFLTSNSLTTDNVPLLQRL